MRLFLRPWGASQDAKEESGDKLVGRGTFESEFGHGVVFAEAGEPEAHGSIPEDGGLQGVGSGFALGQWVGSAGAPSERVEHVANGLDARERKAGTVAFVGRGGEHPRAAWMSEGHGVSGVADAVDVETGLLGSKGFSGGNECGVDDLFSRQAARGGGSE